MFQHYPHIRWLAKNAHIGQHTVIYKIMSPSSIAAIFFALEFTPLRLFDFSRNRCDDHVAPESDARALQRLDSVRVADQRALHVVNAEAINESISHDCIRLVTNTG